MGVYAGCRRKLRGGMAKKWPKIDHIPPHFLFEADIWLPGIYFHLCLDHRPEITVLGHTAFCRITRDF